jgi:hypothetical protein
MATDDVDPICVEIFKTRGHTVDVVKTLPEAELVYQVANYDGMVVRSATKVLTRNYVKMTFTELFRSHQRFSTLLARCELLVVLVFKWILFFLVLD